MGVERHDVAGAAGMVAIVVTVYVADTTVLSGATAWAAILVATLVTGVGLGYAKYVIDSRSDDENRPFFDSPVAYVAFWGLFYASMVHAMTGVSIGEADGSIVTSVVPGWAVAAAFLALALVAVALGGIDRNVRPSYWRRAYREGRSRD